MSLQKLATLVSSVTAFLLLVIKFVVGLFSGSIAVLSSAIDSLLDLFVSIFNFVAIKNSEKNLDKKFNYGRGKIEALASLFEGIIITFSGIYILYASIMKLITGDKIEYLGISVIVMMISVVITGCLVLFLEYVGKKTNNLVIKADALHYKADLYTNGGILLALGVIYFTGFYSADGIIGIIISLYVIYSAYPLIKEGFLLTLDIALPKKEVKKIIEIIKEEDEVNDFHYLRTRQAGKYKFVDVHLVFNTTIKLLDAHTISDKIEERIEKEVDGDKEWIINIHLDPYDDSEANDEKCRVFIKAESKIK